MKNKQETEILNIGSSNLSCKKKLEDLRCFQREKDWTRDVNDDETKKILGGFLREGVQMAQQCEKSGLSFYN